MRVVGLTAARSSLASACAALLLAASPAAARMHAGPNVLHAGHRLQGAIAPLDGGGSLAIPAAAYSLRRLKSTYTGPGVKLRRTTGGTQDIGFLGFTGFTGAPLDVAAAASFCASTTCFIDTWYDQSGNARHAVQATPANQPAFTFNCNGTLPCVRTTTTTQGVGLTSPAIAGAQSFSTVAREDTISQNCIWIAAVNNRLVSTFQIDNSAVGVIVAGGSGVWHAANGSVNGASTVLRVNGIENTGTVAVDTTSVGNIYFLFNGPGAGQCSEVEAIWWNGYALTAAERAAMRANQQSFWGTP